jgi:hypothetical protein
MSFTVWFLSFVIVNAKSENQQPHCRLLEDGTNICVTDPQYMHELDLVATSVVEQSKCGTPLGVKGEGIDIRSSPKKGLGVFARSGYRRGEIIELCPTFAHSFSEAAGGHVENNEHGEHHHQAVDRFDLQLLQNVDLSEQEGVEQSSAVHEVAKALNILKLYGMKAFGSGQHQNYLSGGYCAFYNHGGNEKSNAALMDRLCGGRTSTALYALRDIAAGEEILWNYGDEYFDQEECSTPDTVCTLQ